VPQATDARLALDDIIKETAAEGLYAKSIVMTLVTLVAGQTDYVMDGDVLDVVGTGMYIDPSQVDVAHATSETPIMRIDREAWQRLSARAATGRPYQFFSDRSTTPLTIRIWPIPDASNVGTMRMQTHRLPADVTESGVTAPVQRYWTQYLVFELAHQLALQNSLPIERCGYIETLAAAKYKRAKSYSKQQGPKQAMLQHPTAWRAR
jgi:hypothetical protein